MAVSGQLHASATSLATSLPPPPYRGKRSRNPLQRKLGVSPQTDALDNRKILFSCPKEPIFFYSPTRNLVFQLNEGRVSPAVYMGRVRIPASRCNIFCSTPARAGSRILPGTNVIFTNVIYIFNLAV